jgi:predicted ester cyclase
MITKNNTQGLVARFIDEIWNQRQFDKLESFIHPGFTDHSLPAPLPATREGLKEWVLATGQSFDHVTIIEEQVTENDKSMIKIRLMLKHIGVWRGIAPTGAEISVVGYRYFRVADDLIIEHWALIDGNAIENQLRAGNHGCKMQE